MNKDIKVTVGEHEIKPMGNLSFSANFAPERRYPVRYAVETGDFSSKDCDFDYGGGADAVMIGISENKGTERTMQFAHVGPKEATTREWLENWRMLTFMILNAMGDLDHMERQVLENAYRHASEYDFKKRKLEDGQAERG